MKLLNEDTDLDPIRADPEFKRLVEIAIQLAPRKVGIAENSRR
jgi:hypothetical protein